MSIYIPPYAKAISETTQIRLGIQGFPNTGKTWAALTFPNPIVVNIDRGLGAHVGRDGIVELPFYDHKWVRETFKMNDYSRLRLKDVLVQWIEGDGQLLTEEQTLVFDGSTGLQNAYHPWWEANKMKFLTKEGKVDDFSEWTVKKKYFGQIMEAFKSMRCHVVYITHEQDQRDKVPIGQPVTYTGKIKPLLSGGFVDELSSHFTDWFRAHSQAVLAPDQITEETTQRDWKMTKTEWLKWANSFGNGSYYYWQTVGDNIFDAKSGSLVGAPRYLPATYQSFQQFRRK